METVIEVLKILANTASVFFAISASLVFLHCFYDTGFLWTPKKLWFILAYAVLDSLCINLSYEMSWLSYLVLLLQAIVAVYDYRGKKLLGFCRFLILHTIVAVTPTLISMAGSMLISPEAYQPFAQIADSTAELTDPFAFSAPPIPDAIFLFVSVISGLFYAFVFFYLYCHLYRQGVVMRCGKRESAFLIFFPVLGFIVLFAAFFYEWNSAITVAILTIFSILFGLSFPVFIFSARIGQYYRERTIYQENYMQEELAHFTQYKLAQEETARFRHDIRNNLLCLNELLQSDDTEKAKAYLRDLLDVSDTLRAKFVSGDEMLDCIIGVKAGIMEEKQIRFQLDGVLAGGLQWKPVDVCVVFANALDNAIEACTQLPPEDRSIDMRIKSTSLFWLVSITNPVKDAVDTEKLFQKNSGYTSKADAGHHGIGTYNMKNTVENYGGMLKADCREGLFTLEIAIDKSGNHTDIAP